MTESRRAAFPAGRPRVLAIIPLPEVTVAALGERCDLVYRPSGWQAVQSEDLAETRAVVTNGTTGLSSDRMAMMPALGLVSAFGAGYENIDVGAARAREVAVTHAPAANDDTVGDHALALLLSLARDIPRRDRAMRAGGWADIRSPRPTLSGAAVGVLGLGHIGGKIARRAAAFGSHIFYHTPSPKPDCGFTYAASPLALAERSRFLIVACPGGAATRHLVDSKVLDALGPDGFLVNIARGGIVDTQALIAALSSGRIAGAALDVFEGEPNLPPALLALDNLICTPHMAGRSPEAESAQTEILLANLQAFFAKRPLVNPVP
ncbi:MAG TPA: 2-hydroxyacid dehydrogenase [Pseudolabrys sp.]|nr:2-hydroxyacid dehydrogenase [Pseudolabrys sp.]